MKRQDARADAQHDEGERSGAIWELLPSRPGELDPRSRVPRIAHAVLLLMCLVALIVIDVIASNYIRSVKSMSGLGLEIIQLEIIDDSNPRGVIRFRLSNRSPLPIEIERYEFTLRLNEEHIGTSNSTYMGTDPAVDRGSYRKATTIDRSLAPGKNLALEFTLYIYSAQMELVRRAQRSGDMPWSASARFDVILPYGDKEQTIGLSARYSE